MDKNDSGKKVVGAKQTMKCVRTGTASTVYVAKDADKRVTQQVIDLCSEKGIQIVYFNTMKELGSFCGIDVGAATACLMD